MLFEKIQRGTIIYNLILLNCLFFVATYFFPLLVVGQDLRRILGLYYPSSTHFQPFQLVTHLFMHGDFMHLFSNMISLVIAGTSLEKIWGAKRFLIFYLIAGFGAIILHVLVQGILIYKECGTFFPNEFMGLEHPVLQNILNTTTIGASGAVFGCLAAWGYLFANSDYDLFPIFKAKHVAAFLLISAFIAGFQNNPGDHVAHFAHLGGAMMGFILVKIWQKDRTKFW